MQLEKDHMQGKNRLDIKEKENFNLLEQRNWQGRIEKLFAMIATPAFDREKDEIRVSS